MDWKCLKKMGTLNLRIPAGSYCEKQSFSQGQPRNFPSGSHSYSNFIPDVKHCTQVASVLKKPTPPRLYDIGLGGQCPTSSVTFQKKIYIAIRAHLTPCRPAVERWERRTGGKAVWNCYSHSQTTPRSPIFMTAGFRSALEYTLCDMFSLNLSLSVE